MFCAQAAQRATHVFGGGCGGGLLDVDIRLAGASVIDQNRSGIQSRISGHLASDLALAASFLYLAPCVLVSHPPPANAMAFLALHDLRLFHFQRQSRFFMSGGGVVLDWCVLVYAGVCWWR